MVCVFAAAAACVALTVRLWAPGAPTNLIVRSGGKVFAELSLARDQALSVPGPLGESRVEIVKGRARVARDPSPRQYCVKQGWLEHPGEAALCLPNRLSIEIAGTRLYDSLNY